MTVLAVQQEWFIAMVAAFYLYTCFRVARRMGAIGRSTGKWFLISLFASAIPATIVLIKEMRRRQEAHDEPVRTQPDAKETPQSDDTAHSQAGLPRRCPHCHQLLAEDQPQAVVPQCPSCKMTIDEGRYA